jgi:hypothetical protein
MKKLLVIALVLLVAAPVFGAVAVKDITGKTVEATTIHVKGQQGSFDGSTASILANGHKEGVTAVVTGKVTNISGTDFLSYGVIEFADHGTGVISRQIALANGTPGQMVTIMLKASTGTFTLYITDDGVAPGVFTMTKTGWDDIAFDAALDCVTLLYVDDQIGWILVGGNSVTVT